MYVYTYLYIYIFIYIFMHKQFFIGNCRFEKNAFKVFEFSCTIFYILLFDILFYMLHTIDLWKKNFDFFQPSTYVSSLKFGKCAKRLIWLRSSLSNWYFEILTVFKMKISQMENELSSECSCLMSLQKYYTIIKY